MVQQLWERAKNEPLVALVSGLAVAYCVYAVLVEGRSVQEVASEDYLTGVITTIATVAARLSVYGPKTVREKIEAAKLPEPDVPEAYQQGDFTPDV